MAIASRRAIQLAVSLSILGLAANYAIPNAASQEAGWITLFDGKSLDGWDQVGESNWRVEDGAIVVDKMAGKDAGYLVSKNSYKNFVVRVEFFPSDNANSGIYFRCLDPKKITDRDLLRGKYFRPTYRPELWHRRDHPLHRGQSNAEGRRQMEYL